MSKYIEIIRLFYIIIFCLTLINTASSQKIYPDSENNILNTVIEDYISSHDDVLIDPVYFYENLSNLRSNPLDLNTADYEDFQQIFFLDSKTINLILQYRKTYGKFLSIYELQAVPFLGLELVRTILPFVIVNSSNSNSNLSVLKMLTAGKNDLYLKCEQIVEQQEGYLQERKKLGKSYYHGDNKRVFLRFKHQYGNKLSAGLIAEKDPGEEFFKGSNAYGFDYYSFHLFAKNINENIKAIAIGDYAVSFGQGLILNSGFGYGKNSMTTLIKRGGQTITPYTSTLENNFFRGAAITLQPVKYLEITAFASSKFIDANIIGADSTLDEDTGFSSLQTSGLHRISSEIQDKHAIRQTNAGGSMKFILPTGHIAFNSLYTLFNKNFNRDLRLDNQFAFKGNRLLNLSFDYSYIYQNFYFFGEFAKADLKSLASINGVIIALDKYVDVAVLYRNLPVDYHALNANVFAEVSDASNEKGLYLGTQIYPAKGWILNAYYDIWKNPWLKFSLDKPGTGYEYFVKLQYSIKKKLEVYIQFRNELKESNNTELSTLSNAGIQNRQNLRVHLNNKLSNRIELRNRAEWSYFKGPNGNTSRGFMIYQDILFKPVSFPFSFTGRLAFFDTQDYNSRIYAFENELLYGFSIPQFYFKGMRWYLNIRSGIVKNLLLEAGVSQTIYTNQNNISSGLEQINGNHKTELKAQIKYSF